MRVKYRHSAPDAKEWTEEWTGSREGGAHGADGSRPGAGQRLEATAVWLPESARSGEETGIEASASCIPVR